MHGFHYSPPNAERTPRLNAARSSCCAHHNADVHIDAVRFARDLATGRYARRVEEDLHILRAKRGNGNADVLREQRQAPRQIRR